MFPENMQKHLTTNKTAGRILYIHTFKASFGSSGFEHKTEEDIKLRQFNTDIDLESLKFNYPFLSRVFLSNSVIPQQ
jgi:hypothetical protein